MVLEIIILICVLAIFVILARRIPDIVRSVKKTRNIESVKKDFPSVSKTFDITDTSDTLGSLSAQADLFFEKGDFYKAEKLYIQMATKELDNPKIYNRLGAIYLEQKNFSDAKAAFQEAIRFDTKKASHYFNLSVACLELKEYRNAIESLEKAVKLDKKNKKYLQALKETRKKLS